MSMTAITNGYRKISTLAYTLIIEVEMSQNMRQLQRKAARRTEVPRGRYIVRMRAGRQCVSFSNKFFEIVENTLVQLDKHVTFKQALVTTSLDTFPWIPKNYRA